MSQCIRILVPVFPKNCKEIYFKGSMDVTSQDSITIYVTQYSESVKITADDIDDDVIYGLYGVNLPKKYNKFHNFIIFKLTHHSSNPYLYKVIIRSKEINLKDCIIIHYDYNKIRDSETISHTEDYFTTLQNLIHDDCGQLLNSSTYEAAFRQPDWLSSSMFLQHIFNYINLLKWFLVTLKNDKKISIKQGNLILAILSDILLGYIVLQLFLQDPKDISFQLRGMLEKLINLLYSLLKWLMGDPVGLKLNNAFNKMLGKYFSYHVQLWWLFLDVSGEKLDTMLQIFHYMGYLGFTFQTAVISDLICIATFHSYCIYVYAARLFNIQISGLIALLRLFVGRKYNPLRGGIDSCEYTNQELFVGTVAFTILLLLLPTTALYYIVFTVFRVLSLAVQHILAKCIYLTQTLPLYVVYLWIVKSPKVAGNILIEVEDNVKAAPLVLKVKLLSNSIKELINNFRPPVEVPNQVQWGNLLSNILIGKQIV